jgi:hypothetical protein
VVYPIAWLDEWTNVGPYWSGRFSSSPYDAVYSTPNQAAKVGQLFPEGAERFAGRLSSNA